jgi:hypothetical protein
MRIWPTTLSLHGDDGILLSTCLLGSLIEYLENFAFVVTAASASLSQYAQIFRKLGADVSLLSLCLIS